MIELGQHIPSFRPSRGASTKLGTGRKMVDRDPSAAAKKLKDGQIYFRPPVHSDALRAEDVSRSGYFGHRNTVVVVSRCTRASAPLGFLHCLREAHLLMLVCK